MTSPPTSPRFRPWATALWQAFTRPHPRLTAPEDRRGSQLLAALVLVVNPLSVVIILLIIWNDPTTLTNSANVAGALAVVLLSATYFINRAGYFRLAAGLYVGIVLVVAIAGSFLPDSEVYFLLFVSMPVLFAALFFRVRVVILVMVVSVIGAFGLIATNRQIDPIIYSYAMAAVVLIDSVVITLKWHLQGIERERQAELQAINAQLRASEALLEQRVDERTRELAEALTAAEAARQRAEQADQVKSQFLASMSHELRTPLNAVINFSKFLHRGMFGPVSDEQKGALDKVIASSTHLLGLINDVLDLSKLESGLFQLVVEDGVDLRHELAQLQAVAESLLDEKPVTVVIEIAPDTPLIRADRQRVRQILLNLISNACKFTSEGEIRVQMWRDAENIWLSVQDSGPGIAPEDQEIIFERFRQGGAGLRKGKGTGLGLPIARMLAEAHHGRLWVESEIGQGALFYLTLPILSPDLELFIV